jgi:hypothetical protein
VGILMAVQPDEIVILLESGGFEDTGSRNSRLWPLRSRDSRGTDTEAKKTSARCNQCISIKRRGFL